MRAIGWRMAVGASVVGGVLLVGCGARTGLLVPTPEAGAVVGDDAAGGDASCTPKPVAVDPNVPNLYFVLDVSSSMAEMSKWTNMRAVIGQLLTQLGPSASFGAAVFPAPMGHDVCAAGAEVMSLRLGDAQGATEQAFLDATNFPPNGGTPTAATLQALAPELEALHGPTFVILATDGGPNCDAALTCDLATCTSNIDGAPGCPAQGPSCCVPSKAGGLGCLDGARTLAAAATLESLGIDTYVLGIPGSAPYAALLDALAMAGGTARSSEPYYYRADTADTATLSATFAEIAARAMASCAFTLSHAPADPTQVNVAIGGNVIPEDGPDGWSLSGAQLLLRGAACAAIQGGSTPGVTEGCPTRK